jgi:hypothetical protein
MLRHAGAFAQPAGTPVQRAAPYCNGEQPRLEQPRLEGNPNVDAAMLRAGAAAIARRGEKSVVAAGRCPRMIVAVLRDGVAAVVVVMIVTHHRIAALFMPRLLVLMVPDSLVLVLILMVLLMVLGTLILVLLAILRADGQW